MFGSQMANSFFSPQQLASKGRDGDTKIAHLTPGEIIIPKEIAQMRPDIMMALAQQLQQFGVDPRSIVVGSGNINPETGLEEFNTPEEIQQLVAQSYQEVLGREADAEGLQYWTDRYAQGDLTEQQFESALAQGALDYDASGITDTGWLNQINQDQVNAQNFLSGGQTSAATPSATTSSSPTSTSSSSPTVSQTTSSGPVAAAPTTSGTSSTDLSGFINQSYLDVLGREADPEGLQYWTERYSQGDLTADQFKAALAKGALEVNASPLSGDWLNFVLDDKSNAQRFLNGEEVINRLASGGSITEEEITGLKPEELDMIISEAVKGASAEQAELIASLGDQVKNLASQLSRVNTDGIQRGGAEQNNFVAQLLKQIQEAMMMWQTATGTMPFRFVGQGQRQGFMSDGVYRYFDADERDAVAMGNGGPGGMSNRVRGWGRQIVDL